MVIPRIDLRQGGPSSAVCSLCHALALQGVHVDLLTLDPGLSPVPEYCGAGYDVEFHGPCVPKRYSNSSSLIRSLRKKSGQLDLIHVHNLWNVLTTRTLALAVELRVPAVLSPHGMLSAWRRSWRAIHKEVYFRTFDRRLVTAVNLIHFVSVAEHRQSKAHIANTPYCVVPNGVWLDESKKSDVAGFRAKYHLNASRYVLFLGRIHPIKRLAIQCEAFALLARRYPDLKWVFVGPDEGELPLLERSLRANGLLDRAVFTGLLTGPAKLGALGGAEIYCQTSAHEGCSHAIVEALSFGKPCVITEGCALPQVASEGAGFVVTGDREPVAAAIDRVLSDQELARSCGRNARRLAESMSWPRVGSAMINEYIGALDRMALRSGNQRTIP